MPEISSPVISLFHSAVHHDEYALFKPERTGAVEPLRLWILQVGVIVSTASILALVLKRFKQPKVIAEVLGGIILGPTAFGQIPGFTDTVFPQYSRPYLSLVANIGLCLFLFLVGLEIDGAIVRRNARLSATIALFGMAVPFALGASLAVPLYNTYIDSERVQFAHFMLFTGIAFSITAFPVLCRILTELKLLDTTVGIVVLSAGVGNDVVGWALLALSVALVNAGSAVTALHILLICIAWTIWILFPVKWVLHWIARTTGSLENGPSMFFMTATMLTVFGSAFFTDAIGVHAIFGAFIVGIIVPREGGLAIALTEKLEDMVSIIFLPLYFTLSGLSTDLTLLNSRVTWGYTLAICVLAFMGKFFSCMLSARYAAGFNWRESGAIGSLMSCKGLVELIVLNVGLSAGILTPLVFSMFVVEALVLTFATSPLTLAIYPPQYREVISTSVGILENGLENDSGPKGHDDDGLKRRFTVVLDKLEHLPSIMALTLLVSPAKPSPGSRISNGTCSGTERPSVEALRVIELSDRVSAVMKSQHMDSLLQSDPLLSVFKMFGNLHDITVAGALSIVRDKDLSITVTEHAHKHDSDMILVPWLPPLIASEPYFEGEIELPLSPRNHTLDAIFKTSPATQHPSTTHSRFVRGIFSQSTTDVALFVEQGSIVGSSHHIFLPFFGGPDDRLALQFVGQLCLNPKITATVVRIARLDANAPASPLPVGFTNELAQQSNVTIDSAAAALAAFPDTIYSANNTEVRMHSDTADNIIWAKYAHPTPDHSTNLPTSALARIEFRTVGTPTPLTTMITKAGELYHTQSDNLLIVVGRSRRLAVENHTKELKDLMQQTRRISSEVTKTLGDVASAFLAGNSGSGIVVIQASERSTV